MCDRSNGTFWHIPRYYKTMLGSDDIIFRNHYEKQEILCFSLALKITENKPDWLIHV